MKKGRLEAFTDGVVAIIITIMVLELRVPHPDPLSAHGDSLSAHADDISALRPVLPAFFSYILSFIYIGIYWNNHHHLLYVVDKINGAALWANLNLLFWLSLVPFVTAWMGDNHFSQWPVVVYGMVLIMNALSFTLLSNVLVRHSGEHSTLARALGKDAKGKISLVIYAAGIGIAFSKPLVAVCLYAVVAVIWFIPDRRIEKKLTGDGSPDHG